MQSMKLSDWMERHGVSDAVLAGRVGVERVTITRLRNQTALPSMTLAMRIREVTKGKVKADDLIPSGEPVRSGGGR